MQNLSQELNSFITELDAGVEAHLEWTNRVMRCAVLRISPGNDVLNPLAHNFCRFGCWFISRKSDFEKLNSQSTQRLMNVHQSMHDAIRSICSDVLAERSGNALDLENFEQAQAELIKLLADFKTQFLSTAVRHDHLTGLPLRYGIEEEFIQLQKLCKRNKLMIYAVMIDVDHFKRINDQYGHPVGDIALRHLADTLKRNIRPNEPLYRWGGEEFLLLIQTQTLEEAILVADRLINIVRSTPVLITNNESLTLNITMGVALAKGDEALGSVIERADRALYDGKRAGRNRYVIAPQKSPMPKPDESLKHTDFLPIDLG
jgi:diguanylate cyclase